MPDLLKFPMSAIFIDAETTSILFEHWVGSYPFTDTKVECGGKLYSINRVAAASTYNRLVVVLVPASRPAAIDEEALEKALIRILQSAVV